MQKVEGSNPSGASEKACICRSFLWWLVRGDLDTPTSERFSAREQDDEDLAVSACGRRTGWAEMIASARLDRLQTRWASPRPTHESATPTRTIDARLRSIFRKLDITSGRQLRGMALGESVGAGSVETLNPLSVRQPP
jgi:hypothetical protein